MNFFLLLNDCIICISIIIIIIYGTRLINNYNNFYHIYNYLDYEQKLGYFKSNYLVNFISKYNIIKKIFVYYFLIPIIKLNNIIIFILVRLLYSLCHTELKKIIKDQNKKKYYNKKNKKKTLDIILFESTNNFVDEKIFNKNISKKLINQNIIKNNFFIEENNFNEEINYNKILNDDNTNILNIIENISDTESKINDEKIKIKELENEIDKETKTIIINNFDSDKHNSIDNLNLLNEIDLLKYSHNGHIEKNKNNSLNEKFNNFNDICNFQIDEENNNDILENYISSNLYNDYYIKQENNYDQNEIKEYFILDNKSEDNNNDTINLDDIDFGINIIKKNEQNESLNDNLNIIEKKIIKIGKKKNK